MKKCVQVKMQKCDAPKWFWTYTLNQLVRVNRISSLFVLVFLLDSLTIRKTWKITSLIFQSFRDLTHQLNNINWSVILLFDASIISLVLCFSHINTHTHTQKSYFLSCTTSPPRSSRLVLFISPLSSPSVFSRPCLPCADLIRPLLGNKECRHLFSGKIKTYSVLRQRRGGLEEVNEVELNQPDQWEFKENETMSCNKQM